MSLLEENLQEIRDIRSSGAVIPETTYYTPMANLLYEVGKPLKPRFRAILQLAKRGAGQPYGGLFTDACKEHPVPVEWTKSMVHPGGLELRYADLR